MAVWQYEIYLIPENTVGPDGKIAGLTHNEEEFTLPPLQFEMPLPELEELIADVFPPSKSWSPHIHVFGDEQKHDAYVMFENDQIKEVRLRIDLRCITLTIVQQILALAQSLHCCFLEARTLEIVPAAENALIASIRKSSPAAFVRNPQSFLKGISNRGTET